MEAPRDSDIDGWLTRASLAYLGLPILIFLAFWLKPVFAGPAILVTGLGLWGLWRQYPERSGFPVEVWRFVLVAFVATCLSGAGGIGLQNWDYDKHNAVLHDLTTRALPVRYANEGDPALAGPLVYYMGWYMPAMVIGRTLGWGAANAALFLWTLLGLSLALSWFARLARGTGWWPSVFLLLFSGMDIVGATVQGRNVLAMTNLELHHWAGFAQYTHNLALINWVPHHALPMWLATALALFEILERRRRDPLVGPWALLPFWSPWIFLGLAPLLAVGSIQGKGRFISWASIGVAAGSLPFVLVFLASSRGAVVRGWAWTYFGGWSFAGSYVGFVMAEFALVGFLVWRILRPMGTERGLLGVAIGGLFLLPLYRFGISGDLTMRASLPLLFVLAIFAFRAVATEPGRLRTALLVVLGVGALSPLHEIGYAVAHYRFGPPDPKSLRTLPFTDGRGYAKQFVGDGEKPFWQILAR